MMPALHGPAVGLQGGLLHQPPRGGHDEEVVAHGEVADGAAVGDLLALGEVQQVDHGPAAAVAGQLRQVVDLAPVDLALGGEEEQVGVRAGDEEVLDGVFLFGLGAGEALAAAVLGPVGRGGSPLDVAVAADGDHHGLFGDEVFEVEVADFFAADLGAAGLGVFPPQLAEVLADQVQHVFPVGEEALILDDLFQQLAVLAGEFFLFEVDQLAQGHAEDAVGLHGREVVGFLAAAFRLEDGEALVAQGAAEDGRRRGDLHEPLFGLFLGLRCADDADHLVDVGVGQQEALDHVLPLPGAGEEELGAAANHQLAVADEFLQQVLQRQHPRLAVDQRQEDQRETVLQGRELVELVEHDLRIGVALQLEDEADRLLQVAFVAGGRNAGDPPLVDQGGDPLLDAVAGLLEGDLADHDAEAILAVLLDPRPRPDDHRAAARVIAAADAAAAANHAAGGEVGAGHDLHQLVDRHVGVVDHADQGVADLAQVVRRDRRGHAHRDAVGPVDQQVGELRRQHRGLQPPLVVGGDIVDRVELEVLQHERGDGREAGLGIPHGRRRQARDRAEVALLIDQHVAHVPFLGHAHQGGIDDAFAVGMVVAAGVAGDFGALHPARPRREVQVVHGDQDAALRGLQAVAHVGQRAADDHAHGVRQVAAVSARLRWAAG